MLLTCMLFIPFAAHASTPADSRYFIGGVVSFHSRSASVDFGSGRSVPVLCQPLRTQGLVYGKNFRMPGDLRLKLPFFLEYGEVRERTLEDESVIVDNIQVDHVALTIYSNVYHAGCRPSVERSVRLTGKTWGFISAGGGIHYIAFNEEGRNNKVMVDGKNIPVRMISENSEYLEDSNNFSVSFSMGAGLDSKFGKGLLFSLHYSFLCWDPIKRRTSQDLYPLEAMPLKERFLTHVLAIMMLIEKR